MDLSVSGGSLYIYTKETRYGRPVVTVGTHLVVVIVEEHTTE